MINKSAIYRQRVVEHPWLAIAASLIFIVISLFAWRHYHYTLLCRQTHFNTTPLVSTIAAQATAAEEVLFFPGSVLAWHEAPVYARAMGYLKVWYVDIGYHVKKGDVLAVIQRPELDAQLHEAEDYLKVVTAQNELAQITAHRWNQLVKTDSVSRQANDNKTYEAAALASSLSKARANLEKLRAYVSFENVIAPFAGTISLRETDIGALINIGSNPAAAKPLFRIVQTDPLRLYVNIPQLYSARIKTNMRINLKFVEHPGKTFHAQLLKTAGAIDPLTLTLQAEFAVDNKQNILLPGSYTMVAFSIPTNPDSVVLPVNTLLFREEGLQVATLDATHRVQLKLIEIGTDFGKTIQINSGIQPGEQIILNPPDAIYNGQVVRVANFGEKKSAD